MIILWRLSKLKGSFYYRLKTKFYLMFTTMALYTKIMFYLNLFMSNCVSGWQLRQIFVTETNHVSKKRTIIKKCLLQPTPSYINFWSNNYNFLNWVELMLVFFYCVISRHLKYGKIYEQKMWRISRTAISNYVSK